ncbi:MAG TPA: CYCXC family (seleno)protein [Candidatus Acidoferrum sp.]|nr:CYCXC family (seleno)protein [Candidatus Acidoferrum sp.]
MHRVGRIGGALILFGAALALALVSVRATSGSSQEAGAQDNSIPAYHAQAPKGELPETLSPENFTDPLVKNAYTVAAKIKKTLYQQPCYCHCDRSKGHTSLLDCFASEHGSGCGTCIYEDLYTYEQMHKGKTAAQIREGIIKGDWKSIDAAKYKQPLPAK